MDTFERIIEKLENFTRKYYSKLLLKGVFLFFALGALLFLFVTGVEYFFWLGSAGRLVLLLLFVVLGLGLGYLYVVIPILYLAKVKRGISQKEASYLIGKHFSSVGDKLKNLLELSQQGKRSDLLIAAIEQRSKEMKSIPFVEAVNFNESYRYLKYVLIPIVVVALIWLSGAFADFFGSYNRVVNYDMAYEPPRPFEFQILNTDLSVLDGDPFVLRVTTEGKIRPDEMVLVTGEERLLMQNTEGVFEYTLKPPIRVSSFFLAANGTNSRVYDIRVIRTPTITNFEMHLNFPAYLNTPNKVLTGTGNAVIPEGTKVEWRLEGLDTGNVTFTVGDSTKQFGFNEKYFGYEKRVFDNMQYTLATSNQWVKKYEELTYELKVIRDNRPSLRVIQILDSLDANVSYYEGMASDDHGLATVDMVYYQEGQPQNGKRLSLIATEANVEQFYYTFPSGIEVEEGKVYELYFEAKDNDALRGGKVTKSQVFKTAVLDNNQLENNRLTNQDKLIKGLGNNLEELKRQQEELESISQKQKQDKNLDYNEQQKIGNFLKRQQLQETMMEKFTKELRENLSNKENTSERDKMLQERLERQEIEARKNQKLLEELSKVADKIDKEELKDRLEELGKSQNSNVRNLEQLLELTKRYYVTEKATQLGRLLEKLSEAQKSLSAIEMGQDFSDREQNRLNEKFEEISNELDDLEKDNQKLRKPLELGVKEGEQESIKEDQKEALEEINKHQGMDSSAQQEEKEQVGNKAREKQRSAADKMKQLSVKLQKGAASMGGGSSVVEDAEMLRQILDNLVVFSFKQEQLFNTMDEQGGSLGQFSRTVRSQKELRQLFEHVDDSLFALSLRRAELSEFVNEQITEVYYNVDKSLESIAENQVYQAASYQQYAFTASNALADFLANILDNMQQSMMSGKGQGQGNGFQLPDIIQSQQQLQERMKGSSKGENEGSSGKNKEGETGKDGEKGSKGQGEQPRSGKQEGRGNERNGQGNGEGGNGEYSEEALREIYEIYKEQQVIRKRLEQQLEDIIEENDKELARKLTLEMERFEEELLKSGITERTLNRMNRIQHRLMRLENAALEQGERKERESDENKKEFSNPILTKPELLENKSSNIEILNRQALPLRRRYQNRVKEYFKDGY